MKYGYDISTGHLFSFDKDFKYEGMHMMPPNREGNEIFITNGCIDVGLSDRLYGCMFASGWDDKVIVLDANGNSLKYYLVGKDMIGFWSKNLYVGDKQYKDALLKYPLCVCGDAVYNPDKMLSICCLHPTSRMFACPIVEQLASFGVLASKLGRNPYRMKFQWENKDVIDCDFKGFDKSLDGDSYGRMADLVTHGLRPVNEIMNTVGVSPFFNRVIHRHYEEGCVFIVRMADVDRLFPQIPISAKNYVATSVPVKMKTSCEFRKESGYNGEFADVFVSTDYIQDIGIFMRFFKTFSGIGIVCTSDKDNISKSMCVPLFRSDRVYRMSVSQYEQINRAI